ncbi:MAG: ABC transporter permease [Anaerolineaceae bacterium]|nr:ABC transporter permease [Anaerolineaceae bacterium]
MKKYLNNILTSLICFLFVIILNFALPRMLPGDPIAYLSGFAEEEMTAVQVEYYRNALHLDESLPGQFSHYLRSLTDGTLGYSFKKKANVADLIGEKVKVTLQITLPAVILSTLLGLVWGMASGYRRDSLPDKASTTGMIILNAVPSFLAALVLIILFGFHWKILPYTGLSSSGMVPGNPGFLADRIRHLLLPVLTLVLGILPSRYLLMRSSVRSAANERYVLYAKQRGLSDRKIKYGYILRNIAQPFISMTGMSVSLCIGGSLVIENIFSIGGMGKLLSDAVYSLDYPLMQGILFVTTGICVLSIILTDIICILVDPRVRYSERGREA